MNNNLYIIPYPNYQNIKRDRDTWEVINDSGNWVVTLWSKEELNDFVNYYHYENGYNIHLYDKVKELTK